MGFTDAPYAATSWLRPSRGCAHEGSPTKFLGLNAILDQIFLQIFRRLVLGWIDADFCVQILILQHFSRSTKLSG